MRKAYLYATGGLADILRELYRTYRYCKKNNFNLIHFETEYYKSSNFFDIFKFNFDIPFAYGEKKLNVENLQYFQNQYIKKINGNNYCFFCDRCRSNRRVCIKQYLNKKIIPEDVFNCCYETNFGSFLALKNLELKEKFKIKLKNYIKKNKLDQDYMSVHIRGTDRSNDYRKYGFSNINEYIEKVSIQINQSKIPVYVSTDDAYILELLIKKTNKDFLFNEEIIFQLNKKNLHSEGDKNPKILENAVIDLFVLARGLDIIPSVGGFSRLAFQLWGDQPTGDSLNKKIGKKILLVEDFVDANFKEISKNFYYQKILFL